MGCKNYTVGCKKALRLGGASFLLGEAFVLRSTMPTWKLYEGDCLEVMRELPDNSVDAVVTDPPYGLEFMGRACKANL